MNPTLVFDSLLSCHDQAVIDVPQFAVGVAVPTPAMTALTPSRDSYVTHMTLLILKTALSAAGTIEGQDRATAHRVFALC